MSNKIVIFLMAVTPLALLPQVFLSHDAIPKAVLILIGAALLLFLLPEWMGGLSALWRRGDGRLFLTLAMAEGVSLIVSTVWSSQPSLSFAGTVWRRFGAVEQMAALTIAVAGAALPVRVASLLRAMVVSGGIAALYGVLQYFGVDPFLKRELYAIPFLGGIVRPPGTMGHAIYYSAYLVPIVLLAWGDEEKRWRWAGAGVAVLGCVAIVLSGTRGSILAVACGAAVLAAGSRKLRAGVVIGAGVILAIAGLVAVSPAGAELRHRIAQWRQDPGGPRMGMWRETPGLIARTPVLGAGPETFAVEFRRVESAELSRAYPDFYNETPHNAFLDAACGQGIPGVLILAGLGWLCWKYRGRERRLQAAFVGLMAGAIFASFTLVTFVYLWAVAGLMVAGAGGAERREPGIWRVPAGLMGAVFVGAGVLLAAQDLEYARLRDAVAARNFAGASEAWSGAVAYSFGMPGYELWSSREMAVLGRSLAGSTDAGPAWSKAMEASALAELRSEERFGAFYQSSVLAVSTGDLTKAEGKALAASAIAPNWYKAHLLRAQILQIMGRAEEAGREAQVSRELGWRGQ